MLEKIREWPPEVVYAGLLFFALMRHHKETWAGYAFKAIFGYWPPPDARPAPLDCRGTLLEEWCWARRRREREQGRDRPATKREQIQKEIARAKALKAALARDQGELL